MSTPTKAETRPDAGAPFPKAALTLPDGTQWHTQSLNGKPAVVFFYPKDNTPGCTTEAKDFSALKPEFDSLGVTLLGVSKDPPSSHEKFTAKHALTAPLASDSEEAGLAEALGIWVEKNLYGRKYMGMERTTYLIGADGTIARVWRKVKVKEHAADVLEAARALTA